MILVWTRITQMFLHISPLSLYEEKGSVCSYKVIVWQRHLLWTVMKEKPVKINFAPNSSLWLDALGRKKRTNTGTSCWRWGGYRNINIWDSSHFRTLLLRIVSLLPEWEQELFSESINPHELNVLRQFARKFLPFLRITVPQIWISQHKTNVFLCFCSKSWYFGYYFTVVRRSVEDKNKKESDFPQKHQRFGFQCLNVKLDFGQKKDRKKNHLGINKPNQLLLLT